MKAMPVLFAVLFFFFPAGLTLYYVVRGICMLGQQWYITRKIDRADARASLMPRRHARTTRHHRCRRHPERAWRHRRGARVGRRGARGRESDLRARAATATGAIG
jgi:membrane protein insertase Oxa1/YidC/SpoIIIJ